MRLTILSLTLLAFLYSCSSGTKTNKPAPQPACQKLALVTITPTPIGGMTTTTITYDQYMQTWFTTNCTSCHRVGNKSPDLSTYESAAASASRALAAVQSQRMPPSRPLAANDVYLLQQWINAGMPRSSSLTPAGVTPYPGMVQPGMYPTPTPVNPYPPYPGVTPTPYPYPTPTPGC